MYTRRPEDIRRSYRSSRPEVFCKKGVPENFAKFKGKHLCQILFFNEVAETLAQVFCCEFCKIFKNTFFHRLPPVAASSLMYFQFTFCVQVDTKVTLLVRKILLVIGNSSSLRKKCPYSELFWSECGKMQTRITLNTDTFQAVIGN